jgi:hypothetical protein
MMKYCVAGLALVFLATYSYAQNQSPSTVPWFTAGHVDLNVTDPETMLTASWQFDRAENGDIRVIKQEQRGSAEVAGTLISICSDHALLFKNVAPPRLREMNELDQPILSLQLALKLLARALPQGAHAVAKMSTVDVSDEKNPVRVHKGNNVRRDYSAPWQAHVTTEHSASDGVKFKIFFSYTTNVAVAHNATISLEGVWQQASNMPTLEDAFSIEGWRVYRVNTVANTVGGNVHFDPMVVSLPLYFKTVGELRSRIERNWSKSLQARKQFTCS